MLSNVNNSGDSVCLFIEEEISADVVRRGFLALGYSVGDVYELRDEELQYYVYEPLWLTADKVARLRVAAEQISQTSKTKNI